MKNLTLKDAINKICEEIKSDASYRITWEANIAMAFVDQFRYSGYPYDPKIIHEVANRAAAAFLDQLIGKDLGDEADGMMYLEKLHKQATPLT